MFRRIGLLGFRTARSDEGFKVKFKGMTELVYQERARSLRVGVEVLKGPEHYSIYLSELRNWDPPFQAEPIGLEARDVIKDRIRSALAFMKIKYVES
jgi:hypothetical protein